MPILNTIRSGITKKDIVSTDVVAFLQGGAATQKNANIVALDYYAPHDKQNGIEIAWTMDAADSVANVQVYAARSNGDVVLVCTATLAAGTMVATDGRFYVDTITSFVDNWATDIDTTDIAGNGRMSRVTFDTMGYTYFLCQYDGLEAGSDTIQAVFSGY